MFLYRFTVSFDLRSRKKRDSYRISKQLLVMTLNSKRNFEHKKHLRITFLKLQATIVRMKGAVWLRNDIRAKLSYSSLFLQDLEVVVVVEEEEVDTEAEWEDKECTSSKLPHRSSSNLWILGCNTSRFQIRDSAAHGITWVTKGEVEDKARVVKEVKVEVVVELGKVTEDSSSEDLGDVKWRISLDPNLKRSPSGVLNRMECFLLNKC
jgi:hypothetical protein